MNDIFADAVSETRSDFAAAAVDDLFLDRAQRNEKPCRSPQ
jgi:hypothetical protein